MGRLGRDPEFFRYVEGSVAERILAAVAYALTVLPIHSNPYLDYILTGNFSARPARSICGRRSTPDVKRNLDRLTLFEGPIDEAASRPPRRRVRRLQPLGHLRVPGPADASAALYGRLLDTARPGARFAYWNMLVPRRLAEAFPGRVRSLDAESKALFARDLAFFYSAFVLEEVPGAELR